MNPVDLSRVTRFIVRPKVVEEVEAFFRDRRQAGVEAFALLGGMPRNDQTFLVDFVFIPEQEASPLHVTLGPVSLIEIHEQLPRLGRMFAIQVHTHPGEAYHTNVDEEDTTLIQRGSVSVVVPYFGRLGLVDWTECVVYRRRLDDWSSALHRKEVLALLPIREETS